MSHPLLLHSVSYAGLWGQVQLSVDDFLAKAASLGYAGVMLMAKRPHVSPLDYDAARRAHLRAELAKHDLHHNVLAGYCDLTAGLDRRDIPHKEIQLAYLTSLCELAHDLGIGVVRIFTGYESPHASFPEQWNLVVDTLAEAARRAADCNVVLGLQNHHDIAAGYEALHDILHTVNSPNLRALFDAWAPALHGADLETAGTALGAHTVHTTIADYQRRPRYKYQPALINYEAQLPAVVAVPMGEGFIDYRLFLRAMKTNGFKGTIAYEMCSPLRGGGSLENLDRYARRFLEWAIEAGLTR
ncbi:MAG TPA: sugar phosphate isomerase/epimerase family protein [Bryobacteraceae bacterium]|nr:sugar phosphate isomerase/epimerase family protein [Bryobacteraceae bacterium]